MNTGEVLMDGSILMVVEKGPERYICSYWWPEFQV